MSIFSSSKDLQYSPSSKTAGEKDFKSMFSTNYICVYSLCMFSFYDTTKPILEGGTISS